MPSITIELLEGRTIDQKRKLVESVTEAVVANLGVKPEGVRIRLAEMTRDQLARGGQLYIDK